MPSTNRNEVCVICLDVSQIGQTLIDGAAIDWEPVRLWWYFMSNAVHMPEVNSRYPKETQALAKAI